ncbi:ABC transporter substrate-binding protein [Cellulomonas hominis]
MAVVTAGVLALGAVACSSGGGDADADVKDDQRVGAMDDYGVGDQFRATEPISLSMLYRDHPDYPYQEDWLLVEEVARRANVTFDMTFAPLDGFEQRRSLLISGGDSPDVMPVAYGGQEIPFVASGALLPVSDYFDLMPNFSAKVAAWDLEEWLETLRQKDGKIYLLPGLMEFVRPDYTVTLRTDILAELGLDMPTSWDELADALAAMKAAYPDVTPMTDRYEAKLLLNNTAAATFGFPGAPSGYGGNRATWDEAAGEYVYTAARPEFREMLEYFNGLVKDGLLDPEAFTQDDDQAVNKFVSGQAFAITGNSQFMQGYRESMDETLGAGSYSIAKMPIPTGPAGDVMGGQPIDSGMMISADLAEQDTFVATMQFIDWLYYSDAGMEFATWGVEGTTFERDADGVRSFTPDVDFLGLNPDGDKNLRVDFGFFNGVFMLTQGGTEDLMNSMLPDDEREWREEMVQTKTTLPAPPPYPMDEIDLEQVALWQSALGDYADNNTLAFILGHRDLSEFDQFVSELEGKGMTAYIDKVNEAQRSFAEQNS